MATASLSFSAKQRFSLITMPLLITAIYCLLGKYCKGLHGQVWLEMYIFLKGNAFGIPSNQILQVNFQETAHSEDINTNIILKRISTFLTPEGFMP